MAGPRALLLMLLLLGTVGAAPSAAPPSSYGQGIAAAPSAAPPSSYDQVIAAAPSAAPPSSYDQVIAAAVDTYNRQLNPEYAFRLLEAEPQPDWNPSAGTTQPLRFSIRETVCHPLEKADLSQCDYKPDGADQDCSGFFSPQQSPPTIMVQCEDVEQELSRITRSRWRRFFRGAKRFVRKHGVSIAIGALRLAGRFG